MNKSHNWLCIHEALAFVNSWYYWIIFEKYQYGGYNQILELNIYYLPRLTNTPKKTECPMDRAFSFPPWLWYMEINKKPMCLLVLISGTDWGFGTPFIPPLKHSNANFAFDIFLDNFASCHFICIFAFRNKVRRWLRFLNLRLPIFKSVPHPRHLHEYSTDLFPYI